MPALDFVGPGMEAIALAVDGQQPVALPEAVEQELQSP